MFSEEATLTATGQASANGVDPKTGEVVRPNTRRCLIPAEMAERGLFLKPSGVWGQARRRAVLTVVAGQGAAHQPGQVSGHPETSEAGSS